MTRLFSGLAIALCLLASGCVTPASPSGAATPVQLVRPTDWSRTKIFPLLALMEADVAASDALRADPVLSDIARRSSEALAGAHAACSTTRCLIERMMLPEADITAAGDRIAALAAPGQPLNPMLQNVIRPQGWFARHAALPDGAFARAAWLESAAGLNRLYRVYGLGEAPRYPDIDSISHQSESAGYRALVRAVLETRIDTPAGPLPSSRDTFASIWFDVGLDLLAINQRNEAARYEPMAEGVNTAALARARSIDWSAAPHVAILIPGAGTLPGETGLSAAGALRVRLAARRYADGLAPFIITSGGHVHPNKTPYAEAIEMKRELMDRYGVPENAILVDPHARHTTTNLRNGVRLIHAMGAPEAGTVLVTTSRDQSAYIESPVFLRRNEDELGYQPLTKGSRLSPHDLVMKQNLTSLHIDPRDPLDP